MMKLLGVVLAISVAMGSEIPLKIIYDVVPGFPKVDVCDRMCTSEYWMAPGNVRTVQFTGTLQDSEDARKSFFFSNTVQASQTNSNHQLYPSTETVCNCMYKYIGQMGSNWLDGVAAKCYKQCNNLTLRLTGQPDPTYDATAVDESFDRPLEKLGEIFSQLDEGKIKVAELACQSNTYVDDCGWIHCTLECPLSSDESRTKGGLT